MNPRFARGNGPVQSLDDLLTPGIRRRIPVARQLSRGRGARLGLGDLGATPVEQPRGFVATTEQALDVVDTIVQKVKEGWAWIQKQKETEGKPTPPPTVQPKPAITNWLMAGLAVTIGIALLTGRSPMVSASRPKRAYRKR